MTYADFFFVGGMALGCIAIAGWCLSHLIDSSELDEHQDRYLQQSLHESQWEIWSESKK